MSAILIIAGCSNGDTSTGGGGADIPDTGGSVVTDSGSLLQVEVEDRATVDDVVNLRYTVRNSEGEDQPGTLFWNDNSSSRVRGSGSLKHIYRAAGTYNIAIQPDGEKKQIVGTITVLPAQNCPPLVIPSFTSSSGIPAGIPNPFQIQKVRGCYEFTQSNSGVSTAAEFTITNSQNSSAISLSGAPTADGQSIGFSCEVIIIASVGGIVLPPIRICRTLPAPSGLFTDSGVVTFSSSGSARCTGLVELTGDATALLVTSNEISITCQ